MIKNLFIPEKVRGYYVLPQRVVGFDIGKTSVKATQVYLKGKDVLIERFFEVPIPVNSAPEEYQERCSQAIRTIIAQVGSYDSIHTAISSSQVIFKELKLPFIGRDKIKMVVQYEIEPLLPFSLADAVVDFIITKENTEEKSSELLVAAVQNQYIAQHLALFEAAGVQPDVVTVDLIALYGLFKQIPAYANLQGGTVLLEIEPYTTRMVYLYNGQLRLVRTINKGLIEQAKTVSQALSITPEEAMEHIIRYGLEPDHSPLHVKEIKSAFTHFFQEITFTLQSFISQARPAQTISTIIVFGTSALIKGLPALITQLSGTHSETFNVQTLTNNPNSSIKTKTAIPQTNVISLASALPLPITDGFNLRQKEFSVSDTSTLNKQILIAVGLALFTLLAIAANSFWQLRKLRSELRESEQETVTMLKERFKKIPEDTQSLSEAMSAAEREVKDEGKLWFAFSGASRTQFLKYLLELTTKLDKQALGLVVDKITLSDAQNTMTLKAHVKGYDELIALEKELSQSKLLKNFDHQNDPNFTMVIRLVKPEQGS